MKLSIKITITLMSLIFLISHAEARDPNKKWTLEEAAKSHQENVGARASKPIDHQKYWDKWHNIDRVPPPLKSESSNSGLNLVWSGNAQKVPVTWGQGEYYIEINFGHDKQGGSAWLTIDNSDLKKMVGVPSPFNKEGNYHIVYESGMLSTLQYKTKGKPKITRISKFPTPQLNECTSGQVESKTTYCNSGRTCETGMNTRACASNGGWLPWQTRRPICVSQNRYCP